MFLICDPYTRIMERIRQTRRLRRNGVNLEEAHELTSMIANSNTQETEEITEQPFNRIVAPTPLTTERIAQSRPARPSATQHGSIYPKMEENWNRINLVDAHESTRRALTSWVMEWSEKTKKLDITDLLLDYGADPDIEEDVQTIAHRAAVKNHKLLIRILRYHKYKFAAYNSLGETPLTVAIAYGHEDIANYLWCSSNVTQITKDNSTVLHYAARYGNGCLVRAACEEKSKIDIDQKTIPDNYTALHLAAIFHSDVMNIFIRYGANTKEINSNGKTPQDCTTDKFR
ncbi:Uncharacterized protein APZ42_032993 [Daphnia magna]|uniref:Uncharacterized protein n=1 Tax=Daphnia magna TaxID=35525 RepID=A0A164LIT9_9CRUS|nr:Uncharacterized protein APZ42_032993 [Daphnia magna]